MPRRCFLVDYDIKLAHVSLCHTANCNNGTLGVYPLWRLATNSYKKSTTRTSDKGASALCLFGAYSFLICSFAAIAWIWYNRADQRPRNNTMLHYCVWWAFLFHSMQLLRWKRFDSLFSDTLAFSIKDFFRRLTEKMTPFSSSVEAVLLCGGVGYILWRFLCL